MPAHLLSILLLLLAMVSIQLGASVAKQLFPILGPSGTTALRTGLAALLLFMVWRPWSKPLARKAWLPIILYGSSLGCMNLLFYLALERIPLGVTVALEFIGPLALAICSSRRAIDLVWALMAAFGIYLIFPNRADPQTLDPLGVMFALGAALCWALYIIFGKRLGKFGPSGLITAWGMLGAALFTLPFGAETLLSQSIEPKTALLALFVAVFSSALPYSLEMQAMKNLPTKTFGVLMSFEPVVATAIGTAILNDRITSIQGYAIACIMLASAGSILTFKR